MMEFKGEKSEDQPKDSLPSATVAVKFLLS
jgi:hypothetical protein